jgi:NADPH:quinone reductase
MRAIEITRTGGPEVLDAAGSVYLTRPMRTHFNRTYDEFSWRSAELFDAIELGTITVTTGERYRLDDAAQAHRDLENRTTRGSTVLIP